MLWADSGIWSSPQNVLPRGAVWRSCYGSGKVGGFILFLPFPHPQALPFHCSLGRCYLALFFVFIPDHEACGILLPWPGIKPVLPVVEAPSRNHWSTREVPISSEVAWPVTLLTLEWWPWCWVKSSLNTVSWGEGAEEDEGCIASMYITCPAVSCWWFWPFHLYQLSWQFHWCGRIEVRALVGSQGGGSSWSTGRHPARHWYLCISHVCTHARSYRTHKFHTWPRGASLSLQPNWCSKDEVETDGVNSW